MTAKLESHGPLICEYCMSRLDISDGNGEDQECSSSKRQKLDSNEHIASLEKCPVCLDILNPTFVNEIASAVLADFMTQGYDTTTFSISTIIPFSIWIREYLTYLSRGREFIFQDRKTAMKRQLKKIFSRGIVECSNSRIRYDTNSNFEIQIVLCHEVADRQVSQLFALLYPMRAQRRRESGVTFAIVDSILIYENLAKFRDLNAFPLTGLDSNCELTKIGYSNAPLYLAGRYNKYSRNVSQTPWSLEGEEAKLDSVEKIISAPVMRLFSPSDIRFTASGREDIDVKMLGTGRPFLLELINPKITSHSKDKCKLIQDELRTNESVTISCFTTAAKSHTPLIKTGEARNKTYRALIYSKAGLTEEHLSVLNRAKDIQLQQKTPIRVLHRRSLATRDKTVYTMSAELRDSKLADLHLTTQSGTYIKEFVHGDMGRTLPNLRQLLQLPDMDIVELDVLDVALDWPVNK